jgi:Spy/CpxP family protein refolding chaperone
MNKKIILSLSTLALVATTLLAYPQGETNQKGDRGEFQKEKRMHHKKDKGGDRFISTVMRLDLDEKQKQSIKDIIKDSMKNIPNPNDAFSDTKFDKSKYIELSNQRRDAKIKNKADMMEKVYAVLNVEQKKDLKTMLDMQDIMKKKGKSCDKNRNDRR